MSTSHPFNSYSSSKNYLFTSESVLEGHPDKMADQISDRILDAFLASDPKARVACETVLADQFVLVAGEFKTALCAYLSVATLEVLLMSGYLRVARSIRKLRLMA